MSSDSQPIKPPVIVQPTKMQARQGRNVPYDQRSAYDVQYAKHRKREIERFRKLRVKARKEDDKALFDLVSVLVAALDGKALYVGPDGNWHEKPLAEAWAQPEAADEKSSRDQRDELNRRMISDFRKSWAVHGPEAVETIAREKPADYLKLIASVMPKEIEQITEHRYVVEIPAQVSGDDWQAQYGIGQGGKALELTANPEADDADSAD